MFSITKSLKAKKHKKILDIVQGNVYNSCAVMKYIYLSTDKKIQGHYSASEILSLLQDGVIASTTLVAAAGDNHWRPASSFTFDVTETECSTWNKEEVILSRCGDDSSGVGLLPGISRIFTWQGRLNRKKFCFIGSTLAVISMLMVSSSSWIISPELTEEILAKSSGMELTIDFVKSLRWYIILYAYFLIISWPILFFSVLSLMVRRFHDVGLSAIWSFFACIFLVSSLFLEDVITYLPLLYAFDVAVIFALLIVCLWPGTKQDNSYGARQ